MVLKIRSTGTTVLKKIEIYDNLGKLENRTDVGRPPGSAQTGQAVIPYFHQSPTKSIKRVFADSRIHYHPYRICART